MTSDQRHAMGRLFDHLDGLDYCFAQLVSVNGAGKKAREAGSGEAVKAALEEVMSDRWDDFVDDLDWCLEIHVPLIPLAYMIEQFLAPEFWDRLPQPVQKFLPE